MSRLWVPLGEDPTGRDGFRIVAVLPQMPEAGVREYPQNRALDGQC